MSGRPPYDHVLHITGGAQLAGDICVSGSKNAALPEMAAALLTTDVVRLNNVPRVTDTALMGEILTGLGGRPRRPHASNDLASRRPDRSFWTGAGSTPGR